MALTGAPGGPTPSGQWSIHAPPRAVAATAVCITAADVLLSAHVSKTQGQWGTVRDMRHEVGSEPPDHRTGSAGLEDGEACQTSSHSPQLLGKGVGGVGGGKGGPQGGWEFCHRDPTGVGT